MEEVIGSTPIRSTKQLCQKQIVSEGAVSVFVEGLCRAIADRTCE
jgi:hypothetical protein